MIEFWLKVWSSPDGENHMNPVIYKKDRWPVLPRIDEWYSLDKELGVQHVFGVTHQGRDRQGNAITFVEFMLEEPEFTQLRSKLGWTDKPPECVS
ncbi:hypothetical protein K2Q00_01160 [Patescibacteria group bacterium]|nr:hypothetical protein [Patescibacteria group bacterium]